MSVQNHGFTSLLEEKLKKHFGVEARKATVEQVYKAVVLAVRDINTEKRRVFSEQAERQGKKQVYYMCMEFLLGRSLHHAITCLGAEEELRRALSAYDLTPEALYELEPDAGLGNGGLGRLAACFMASLAAQDYYATGFSICYELGMFRQKIVDGWQMELADTWLPMGEVWLCPRVEEAVEVHFEGRVEEIWESDRLMVKHLDYRTVRAIPYDLMIPGFGSSGVSRLRLWKSKSEYDIDMKLFSQGDYIRAAEDSTKADMISKILYPPDNHLEGKSLRLQQQYFLVAASLRTVVKEHFERGEPLQTLPDRAVIQLNDTHPALVIPELMRICMDECGYDWDTAWSVVTRSVSYTNHTVMKEALETWNEQIFRTLLPRIWQIVCEINRRFGVDAFARTGGDWDKVSRMSAVAYGQIRMANLCLMGSGKVNGVSALHSEILKQEVFHDFYTLDPQKFTNVTNGVDFVRWLYRANPALTSLLRNCIGDDFLSRPEALRRFMHYEDDAAVLRQLAQIKYDNKVRLIRYVRMRGVRESIDPHSLFDVQAKRLHEYKRQLMNVLHILHLYLTLKDDPDYDLQPRTFFFAAKAASGYYMAKRIIMLICAVSEMVNSDPAVRDRIKVVFLENYSVSMAELLMPAAEISEQISQAGTEASGTGNMKLMLNGALTLGTADGANVEILREVGEENLFLFGLRAHEVREYYRCGYHASLFYHGNPMLKRVLDLLNGGIWGMDFSDIFRSLLIGDGFADPYMVLADFESYRQTQERVSETYRNVGRWNRMSLVNIAKAGYFSSDRSIREYAERIWEVTPVTWN